MSERPSFTVEYLDPVAIEAEPLPEEFSASRLRRSLLILAAIVVVVAAAIVLLPAPSLVVIRKEANVREARDQEEATVRRAM